MTEKHYDVLKKMKQEADDTLFENLVFHEELRQKVKNQIRVGEKKTRFNKIWLSPLFHLVSIAAVLLLVIVTMLIRDSEHKETLDNQPFLGTPDSNLIAGQKLMKTWELSTEEEVKKKLGENVRIPTYIPQQFDLESIHATGMSESELNKAVFTFMDMELSFLVIIERRGKIHDKPLGFEQVQINNSEGYLKTERDVETNITELHWYEGEYHYSVNGLLSPEEAIKVAEAFK
ncbi:DUF4367 domain-containing protein [Fredinandcohnia humi]